MSRFSELLKETRARLNLTQAQVAEKMHVEEETVSAWECERIQAPDPALWGKLCWLMDISVSTLYSMLFDGNETIEIPHLVPKEELWYKMAVDSPLPIPPRMADAYVSCHKIDEHFCCDYKLLLTRQEIEVCLYFMDVYPDMDFFEAFEDVIIPANTQKVRNKLAKTREPSESQSGSHSL